MYGFLRTPKWILGHVLVGAVLVSFPLLGLWQLDRHAQASARVEAVEGQLAQPARPLTDELDAGAEPFARVRAEGVYDADAQVLTAPRSRQGRPGHHVLTPLETDAGRLLVDRGWVPFDRDGADDEALAPPEGRVRVEGLLFPPESGDAGSAEFVAVIDPEVVAARTGGTLLPRHLHLDGETSGSGLLSSPAPAVDEGNHLSYAIQWFLFTAVVLVGYPLLVVRTAREPRRPEDRPRDDGERRPRAPVSGGTL